jgi:type I restriction enzyme S subunit
MKETKAASLPEGWEACCFGDIANIRNGYAFKSDLFKKTKVLETDVPLIRQSQMKGARIDISDAVFLSAEYLKKCPNHVIVKGDVIIGMSGSIGKVCLYDEDIPALQNQRTGKIVPYLSSELNPKFFGLFLSNIERKLTDYAKGMGVQNISSKDIEQLPFNLPPKNEQHRIVAKIEELFSELDQGIASLNTARTQLKVYRQALLKHAFEGKLTVQWREHNRDQLETAAALLARIHTEREQRYQQQLQQWQTSGGSKPKAPKPLPPLTAAELGELPELPEGWSWIKLGELTWSVKDGPHFSPKYVERGIPFISGGNVRPDGVDFENTKFISNELHEELCKRCKPEIDDVLYTKGGTTGIARVNTYDVDFNVWVHVAVLKLTAAVKPFYLQHALNSSFCYSQSQKYTHGVGNQDLGLTRMVHIVLAICSVEEQEEVIRIVDDKMSVIDQLDQTITTSLQQAEALRQSILKKAFSGQIVAQDDRDEPAAALLARIKAERTKSPQPPFAKGGQRRKVSTGDKLSPVEKPLQP